MRLKTARVSIAVGALSIVGVASGTANAADPVYPPALNSVTCVVSTNANGSVLKVNMGPNLKKAKYYTFTVQRQTDTGWVQVGRTYRTKGSKETRALNLRKGTYQVLCQGKYGLGDAMSNAQSLRR